MKYASRKYIDLILKAEGKWASWDPSVPSPEVGDYGEVNEETGFFEKEGNIYDGTFAEYIPDLSSKYQPQQGALNQEMQINSSYARRIDFAAGNEVSVADLAGATIKGTWLFQKRRSALLLMTKPRVTFLPRDVLLKQLVKVPALKDKFLVTEVVICPAYALYLSSKDSDELSLALKGSAPVGGGAVSAGGELSPGWFAKTGNGILKKGGHAEGDDSFRPLFTLKKIRKPFISYRRDSPPPKRENDDLWADAHPPWDVLDSEGEHDEIVADEDIPEW